MAAPEGTDAEFHRRIDRVLDSSYLDDLGSRSDEDLRAMREECAEIETEYSYLRRLAQGRIEILTAEQDRRERGAPLSELIEALPRILADKEQARPGQAQARMPTLLVPKKLDGYARGLERLVEDDTLANLPTLSDEVLAESLDQLRVLEREVSEIRRTLHRAIDALGEEIAGRAKTA